MDLQTMKQKLVNDEYANLGQFEEDFLLIISNCKKFTPNPREYIRKVCEKFENEYTVKMN